MLSIKKYKPKLFFLFTTFCVSAGKAYEIESDTEFCIISSQIFPNVDKFLKKIFSYSLQSAKNRLL